MKSKIKVPREYPLNKLAILTVLESIKGFGRYLYNTKGPPGFDGPLFWLQML